MNGLPLPGNAKLKLYNVDSEVWIWKHGVQRLSTGCDVYDYYSLRCNSLTFSKFTLITSMLTVKLTLFFRYADWLTCHFL